MSVPGKVLNRIILERVKGKVDQTLREQQAGFRQDRTCTGQIATLRIIVEQSIEWNSSLYVNFVDYEKAFDSVDRETLWKVLRHYGVAKKLVNMIKNSYEGKSCRVIHEGQLTKNFEVMTGMLTVTIPLHSRHILGHENGNQGETKWNQLDDADPT